MSVITVNQLRTVWRLVTHCFDPKFGLRWDRINNRIMIGWCAVGDLTQYQSEEEIQRVAEERNCNNLAGHCLWKFYHDIQIGDLVILSTGNGGRRRAVMEVTGDYEYVELPDQSEPRVYAHQRKATPISVNPDDLWVEAGEMATGIGQTIYHTLIRCTNQVPLEEQSNREPPEQDYSGVVHTGSQSGN